MRGMIVAALAALAMPSVAMADAEADKKVGICTLYLLVTQKPNAAERAMALADNRQRAMQFLETEMNQIKRFRERGEWTEDMSRSFAFDGERSCRAIGIRPGDYNG